MANIFKKSKYVKVNLKHKQEAPSVPNGLWVKCNNCGEILEEEMLYV